LLTVRSLRKRLEKKGEDPDFRSGISLGIAKKELAVFCQKNSVSTDYLPAVCVYCLCCLLTLELKEVYNMSRSQCCPLCCRGGERKAPPGWQPSFSHVQLVNEVG